jgi:hypothetical protein
MRLIETGRCLGLVPSSAMRFGGRQLKALPVKFVTSPAPVGFIAVKDRTVTSLAERLIEGTRKVAGGGAAHAPSPAISGSKLSGLSRSIAKLVQ